MDNSIEKDIDKDVEKIYRAMKAKNPFPKVFDWDKAATIIKERGWVTAAAGLEEDWYWTGARIFVEGEPNMNATPYLMSIWATPILVGDEDDEDYIVPCWRFKYDDDGCEWDEHTLWPDSALEILNS